MNESKHRFQFGSRPTGMIAALAAMAVGMTCPQVALGQSSYQTKSGEMVLFESAGATRVAEKVRSASSGVMFAVYVKPGDSVKKGQLLGHLELDATKLQLDLAKHAMESKANVDAAKGQADAWTVTREETEQAVRRRKAEESRLEWAIAMEKMYRGTYELQLDAENAQQIQYDYWKDQYEKRFFRSPVEGIVTEVVVDVGKPVNFATHVFTICNDTTYALPVTVPESIADATMPNETLPVRSADGKSVAKAIVDSVIDNPRAAGSKIIRLFVKATDFPVATRAKLKDMKFDVLLPQIAQETVR